MALVRQRSRTGRELLALPRQRPPTLDPEIDALGELREVEARSTAERLVDVGHGRLGESGGLGQGHGLVERGPGPVDGSPRLGEHDPGVA
jgi:hypothetical protein